MSEEQTKEPTEPTVDESRGLPPGVDAKDVDGSRIAGASKAPEETGAKPESVKIDDAEDAKQNPDTPEDAGVDGSDNDDVNTTELDDYPDYDDDNANAVVDILRESDITVQEANELFAEAIANGDFTKVNLETLTEKLGKSKANLVMLGVQTYYNTVTANTKEIVNAVYDVAGGEDNFGKVKEWARKKASQDNEFKEQMQNFNAMFDLNKSAAVIAAKELIGMYESAANNSSLVKRQVHGNAAASTIGSEPLSRDDYLAQVKEAHNKGDYAKVKELQALRRASRQN